MKKYFKIIITIVFLTGLFVSCEDELEQLPYDEFATENAYVTAQDFENGIRGVYSALTAGGLYGDSSLSVPDVLSDNVTLCQSGRFTKRTIHDYEYNSNSTLLATYNDAYTLIFRANQILFFVQDFQGESKDNIIAEAKALRAMAHFHLVSIFGQIPTQSSDANSSLGVAYVLEADPNIEPARLSVAESYALILDDLVDAKSKINSSNPVGRMGADAVNVLLSRVYLYMGQWQNAIDAANDVTDNVASRDNVVGVWEDTSQDGLLLYIPNVDPILGNSIGVTWSQGPMTQIIPEYVVSFELYNLFADDDIRKEAYTFEGEKSNPNPTPTFYYNSIKKLFGRPGQFNGEVDYKILRAAEANLNMAEAYYNLGNDIAARAALDGLRVNRYITPPNGEVGTALRDAIRLERRLEFAFEYQRFFDLKRWGLSINRNSAGDFSDGTGTPSDVLNLQAGSNLFQLPIAQESIDVNSNLQQNPGY